jgi:hypothetical protein
MEDLARLCPKLKRLHIASFPGLPSDVLTNVCFNQLESLSLAGCDNVYYMSSLFSSSLTEADLGHTGLTNSQMQSLVSLNQLVLISKPKTALDGLWRARISHAWTS